MLLHADLIISARWIVPMTSPRRLLENHALIVRDGRIVDVLPSMQAAARYTSSVHIERSAHVLLPGLIDAYTHLAPAAPTAGPALARERHDDAELCIADMLAAGTTCFCAVGFYPDEFARSAVEQGMRAVIGMPIATTLSAWAASPAEYLTRALRLRDEYRAHRSLTTAFAPIAPTLLDDTTLQRIATLADELDAVIVMPVHESAIELTESQTRHGRRPIDRLHTLGLLTPALNAVHLGQVDEADIALAQRTGIAATLCPAADLRAGDRPLPIAAWAHSGLRLGLGSAGLGSGHGLWSDIKLFSLLGSTPTHTEFEPAIWDALAAVTLGGAATLGLEGQIGSLEPGKWADVCCLALGGPAVRLAARPRAPGAAGSFVSAALGERVSDVWVAGRQLLNDGNYTRLDWPALVDRLDARQQTTVKEH